MKGKRPRLEQFLKQRDIRLYSKERFIRRTSRKNPLIRLDYAIFLDENQRFKKHLFPMVKDIIQQHNLKVYFVMVSWWGRGDHALWTGSHLLKTLREFEKKGLFLPVGEAYCQYHKPLQYDDLIIVRTWIRELKRTSMQFAYTIMKKGEDEIVAEGYTTHVFVNKAMKPCRIPDEIREKVQVVSHV